jgi:hypothetical protein
MSVVGRSPSQRIETRNSPTAALTPLSARPRTWDDSRLTVDADGRDHGPVRMLSGMSECPAHPPVRVPAGELTTYRPGKVSA